MNDRSIDLTGMKILIVDDVPANIDIIRQTLDNEGFSISMATNGETAINIANRVKPDLILLDVMMPGIDGFQTCERLKANENTRDIPVIFVTARDAQQDILKGFSVGAVDYVAKPININELLVRSKNHLSLRRIIQEKDQLIDQLRDTNELLEISARIDVLTGLPNRKNMIERLEFERNRLYGNQKTFSVCMTKFCNFGAINGSYGSYVADQVLLSVGQALQKNIRPADVVGRLYGSEFFIIFPETDLEQAQGIINKLLDAVRKEELAFDGQIIKTCLRFALGSITEDRDDLEGWMKKMMECLEGNQNDWTVVTTQL